MDWFERLNNYFPEDEMKAKQQMDLLLKEKGDHYHKDESDVHILMYAEFEHFVFIDFLWVSEKARGQGIGKKLIQNLKHKGKTILLEVEPLDEDNQDTEKRLRFYTREGFKLAPNIGYVFQAFIAKAETPLSIMYWDSHEKTDNEIYQHMRTVYETIHTYRTYEIYGVNPKQVSDVIWIKNEGGFHD